MTYVIEDLNQYIKERNVEAIQSLKQEYDLIIKDGKLQSKDITSAKRHESFWKQRQQARKILLNSLYGGILNAHCRFYNFNIGQSTTLTGRSIVKHMNAKINEIICNEYDVAGDAIAASDTDSSYFTISPLLEREPELKEVFSTREAVIDLYNDITTQVNLTFASFMDKQFHTGLTRGNIIKAGKELVGSRALFTAKKHYAILMYEYEGNRVDKNGSPGEIKAMGLDTKRADTPKLMQTFLQEMLVDLLSGATEKEIIISIKTFRNKFKALPSWQKGTPKRVNAVLEYSNRVAQVNDMFAIKKLSTKKQSTMVPGHVQASLNWNKMRQSNKDRHSMEIQDGQKVIVCKLKSNPMLMTSIAYPIDEMNLPKWFKTLPFDDTLMEETIIDQKVSNLLSILNWDLTKSKEDTTFFDLFEYSK